jgi:hypothetical protein
MAEEVAITVGPGATHVNVMTPGGPEPVTEAPPIQILLQVRSLMVGTMVIEVGWVMLKVCDLTQLF